MMRPGQVLALVVAGLVLAGGGLWLASRRTDSAGDGGQVLALGQEDLNSVTQLRIFRGDGSHATLTRQADHWIVAERGYPADTGAVRKLLLDLAALKVEEQKTADPALYPRLGVEDPANVRATSTGVDIQVRGKLLSLIVGKTSGTAAVYVRVKGAAHGLLVSPQLAPDVDPRHWLDRTIADIAPDQVSDLLVSVPGGPEYSIARAPAGMTPPYLIRPLPKGREAGDPSAAAAQLGALAGLQLDDVRKASTVPATAHATFHTHDGLELQLSGIPVGEERYITVAASAQAPAAKQRASDLNARLSGWEFQVPGYRYDAVFRPLESLLKPRPAAVGTPATKPHAAPPAPSALPFGPRAAPGGQKGNATPQQSH